MRKFKGGGGSAQPADQKVYSTDLPEYVEPYFKRLLQRGEAESLQGYTPYGGQRLAYFSPDELQSQAMVRGFAEAGTPKEFTDASTAYGDQGSVSSGFTQGDVTSGYTAPVTGPTAYAGAAGGPGRSYTAPTTGPAGLYTAPTTGPVTYGGGSLASDYAAGTFDPGYFAQTRASQYATPDAPGQFTPLSYEENIQRFMSPYQQNVIDIQKREAKRQSDIAASKIQDAATASGGLGGYREAIMQAERERNLGQQLDDIQQRGSQAAFESAQQQLERERASSVTGTQLGLQRFGALQSAAQSQEQLAQQAFNAGQAARQQAAQLGLSAQQQAEAARQAQEKFTQSAFAQTQQAGQAVGAQNLQAFQAMQQAAQAAGTQGLQGFQALQQAGQAAGAQGIQDFQARQQAAQVAGAQNIQAFQAGEAARQQAAKLGLSAEQIEQAGKQAEEKYTQSAFDLSSRYGLAAAQGLMQAGQGIQQDALSRMSLLSDIGRQQRALSQAGMDMGYEDFIRQRDFTRNQLGMFGGLLRGVPVQPQQTISTYQQQPGLFQTALGAGLSGLGLYRGLGRGAA
tara:strand:- start:341 stop:2044 length:1704 start_codon:yes stop_codon:yes gene_type:complete